MDASDNRRIFLLHPPHDLERGRRAYNYNLDVSLPLGLGYIAAVLERAGYQVRVMDAKLERASIGDICRRVKEFAPSIVGMGVYTPDIDVAGRVAREIKSCGDYLTVIGGRHVSALPEETMQAGCWDFGVIGEGEETVVELADAITAGRRVDLEAVRGICFLENGALRRTPQRPLIEDLDKLPLPARHLFPPLKEYTRIFSKWRTPQNVCIATGRGCAYHCIFCDHAVFAGRTRYRSITGVLDEIALLLRESGVRKFTIADELFTMDPLRVESFCRGLISRRLRVSWSCFSRVDHVSPGMLALMRQAGCWMIGYGIESADQAILDRAEKGIDLGQVERAIRWTASAGIISSGYFLLGLPGECGASMQQTISLAKRLPLDRAAFYVAQPYPGSRLYRQALAEARLDKGVKFTHYHNYGFPERLAYLANGISLPMLRQAVTKGYRGFYLRPGYILKEAAAWTRRGFLLQLVFLLRALAFCLARDDKGQAPATLTTAQKS